MPGIRPEYAQRQRVFGEMFQRVCRRVLMSGADEIDVKEILPGLALQWPRLNLGQVYIPQSKDAQGFEQRTGLILQGEDDGGL